MEAWRRVEVAAVRGDGRADRRPTSRRSARATFTVEAVQEREAVTDHDVAAFVDVLQRERRAGRALDPLRADLLRRARHRARPCSCRRPARSSSPARASSSRRWPRGRASTSTPSASGAPTASTPSRRRSASSSPASPSRPTATPSACERAFAQARVGALSGAVGTYSATEPGVRGSACSRASGSSARTVSTQVVPRDRHAELLQAIALAGAGLERLATEIRHLQRTEVREAEEPFRAGQQKGSSAMPHKRNPITTERITGLARVLRGNAQAARRERRAVARARHLATPAPSA